MAGFYAVIIVVGCGRTGQALVADGWLLVVEGHGAIPCTLPSGFDEKIKST